jgi:hypothetical protein
MAVTILAAAQIGTSGALAVGKQTRRRAARTTPITGGRGYPQPSMKGGIRGHPKTSLGEAMSSIPEASSLPLRTPSITLLTTRTQLNELIAS